MNTSQTDATFDVATGFGVALTHPLFWVSLVTVMGAIVGVFYFRRAMAEIKATLSDPDLNEYKIATATYPDALIIKFGKEQGVRSLPTQLKFLNIPWSMMLANLNRGLVQVIYANRRVAGRAMLHDPEVVASQKTLCVYKGFAICLRPEVLEGLGGGTGKLGAEALRASLAHGRILVLKGTDQAIALTGLLERLLRSDQGDKEAKRPEPFDPSRYIIELDPGTDPLETILRDGDNAAKQIGFAAGITERVVAEKLGWGVVAQQQVLPDHREINSFVYIASPHQQQHVTVLPDVLEEVERLWDDTVARLVSEPETQEKFRQFLNEQIGPQLGQLTLEKLGDAQPFSNSDMKRMLSEWLEFPGLGRPVVIAVQRAVAA